jgi:signal transduction histidine kinase
MSGGGVMEEPRRYRKRGSPVREAAHKAAGRARPSLPWRDTRTFADGLFETIREPLVLLDADLRMERANRAFYRTFHVTPVETEARVLSELGNGQWNIPDLRRLLEEVARGGAEIADFRVDGEFPGIGRRVMLLSARRISRDGDPGQKVLLAIEDITARVGAEESTRRLAEELEQRVLARTASLEEDNKELDAFVYSVAHDLRAPLRVIDSFARLLLDDHGSELHDEARHDLVVVRDNAQHMGRLIDDLLAFSRCGRQGLVKGLVSPADLVHEALAALRAEREGRRVKIVVADLPPVEADRGLLKQVFVNLLSNALKFTGRRDVAEIEVGWQRGSNGSDDPVYFVADNGVGFDMGYVDKLFGVFQRLHSAEEYPGTGVGLAIVQRIVHRHGGRIWAAAEVGRGATFFFTLGGSLGGRSAA